MKCMFLITTELSERLFKFIYPKMEERIIFTKFDDIDKFDKPDIIVTAAAHEDINKSIISHFGSKSLLVVEGLNNWKYMKGNYVDKVAVWGKNMKEDFIRAGWQSEKLVITGCPRFETHKRRVLIALPAYGKSEMDSEGFISDITSFLKSKDVIVNVKRHPGVSNEKQDIIEYLRDCEIVITGASTIALHALLMDKNVIFFDTRNNLFNREKHFLPLTKKIKVCYTYSEILNELNQDETIEDYLYDSFGAAKNIIKLINEMGEIRWLELRKSS